MTYTKKIADNVSVIITHSACCYCERYAFNGEIRLQVYKGFLYESPVQYSTVSRYGDLTSITKSEFQRLLNELTAA